MNDEISNIEPLIDSKDIKLKIIEISQKIDIDYKEKEILFLMILKGAVIFTSDLIREIKTPFILEAIKCQSYGPRGTKRGQLTIQGLENLDFKSKDIIIIDDIFDSGNTIATLKKEISKQNPNSIKSLTLLVKKNPNRKISLPDYYLFEIENKFVVGYGLDYKEYFRGLKGIYKIQ